MVLQWRFKGVFERSGKLSEGSLETEKEFRVFQGCLKKVIREFKEG